VHCDGAVNTADQQRSVGGSIHKPSFCGLHMELTPNVSWINVQVHNIVKQIQQFYFYVLLTVHPCIILQIKPQFILSIFINLYIFQVTMCPSSGETTVFMQNLVLVILINILRINCAPSWLYLQELQECLHHTTYHCIKWHGWKQLTNITTTHVFVQCVQLTVDAYRIYRAHHIQYISSLYHTQPVTKQMTPTLHTEWWQRSLSNSETCSVLH